MTDDRPPALEARGIHKSFGNVRALAGVDLVLQPGEIHALLGENGAGKSTLMNVLYGLIAPDEGQILRNGEPTRWGLTRDAIQAGIGMVHQHFTLVPTFTVAENLSLGRKANLFRPRLAAERVQALSERTGLGVDANALVRDLSVGMQQRVEILNALSRDAEILILDEPTGVLAPLEVEELFGVVRRLAETGAAVVFITHKLEEVKRLAHRVTVLRRGERVLFGNAADYSITDLARAMVGEASDFLVEEALGEKLVSEEDETANEEVFLSLKNLAVADDRGALRVRNATFDLHAGETLGIAGVEGSGQTELAEAITGLRAAASGTASLRAKSGSEQDLTRGQPAHYIDAGGAHIPEDRRRTGLALGMPIWENLILESHRRSPVRKGIRLDRTAARSLSRIAVEEYDVQPPRIDALAGQLSGGNQQKVVIAREMGRKPRLLVAVNPTRGLDIRATAYVHQRIREHCAAGGAALLISSELEEVMALSNRIAVMYEGEIAAILPGSASREEIGLRMTRGAEASPESESSAQEDRE